MARTHSLLDAKMDLVLSYEEHDSAVYTITLEFVDIFGRQRHHSAPLVLPRGQKFDERISFTAMSSVNAKTGIIQRIDSKHLHILVFGGSIVSIPNHQDRGLSEGDVVCMFEHSNIFDDNNALEYVALKFPLIIDTDNLRLQTVNADLLDESGNLLYRFSADAILNRSSHAAQLAT